MNSDEERKLLEEWGWKFDSVKRHWAAPDGYTLTLDDLMAAADVMGPFMEARLRAVAREHGTRSL